MNFEDLEKKCEKIGGEFDKVATTGYCDLGGNYLSITGMNVAGQEPSEAKLTIFGKTKTTNIEGESIMKKPNKIKTIGNTYLVVSNKDNDSFKIINKEAE